MARPSRPGLRIDYPKDGRAGRYPTCALPCLILVRVSDIGRVSGLRHSHCIVIAGHFSARGMPNRQCVMSSACGWAPQATPGPSRLPPGGTEVSLSSLAPAREGCGVMRRGQRRAESSWESASATCGNKATALVCCRSPSRHVRQECKRRVRPATLAITMSALVSVI